MAFEYAKWRSDGPRSDQLSRELPEPNFFHPSEVDGFIDRNDRRQHEPVRLTLEQRACVDFLLITQRRLFGECEKLRTALFDLFSLATGRSHYDLRGEGVSKLAKLIKRTSPVDGAVVHAANVHEDTTIGLLALGRFDIRETISGDLEFTLRHWGKRRRFTVPQLRLAAVESVRAVRAATRGVLETTQDLREQLSPPPISPANVTAANSDEKPVRLASGEPLMAKRY